MGGHGGLNILPQKRWNVYNYENREKVRRDEEAAAKEEQLKREQARKRDAEFRLEQLRAAKGLAPLIQSKEPEQSEPSSAGHINLFEGIKIFDPIKGLENGGAVEKAESKMKKMKTEESGSKVVRPEDEKYRLGYGVAGKGVKLPWYLQKPDDVNGGASSDVDDRPLREYQDEKGRNGKKTIEELREERLKREKKEKERERALIQERHQRDRGVARDRRSSRH